MITPEEYYVEQDNGNSPSDGIPRRRRHDAEANDWTVSHTQGNPMHFWLGCMKASLRFSLSRIRCLDIYPER